MRGSRSLWASPGKPIEIELTKITLFPACANLRIRWALECGWWYHQSSPPKQIIERLSSNFKLIRNKSALIRGPCDAQSRHTKGQIHISENPTLTSEDSAQNPIQRR